MNPVLILCISIALAIGFTAGMVLAAVLHTGKAGDEQEPVE